MAFDNPYIPNIDNILSQAGRGYELGTAMRQQNTLSQAGERFAQGDQTGTVNELAKGGQLDKAMEMQTQFRAAARQASADKLAKAQRSNELLGNLALSIKNLPPEAQPHALENAIARARKVGMDVPDEFADPGMLDVIIARAGMTKEALDQELARRKLDVSAAKATTPKPKTFNFRDVEKLSDKGVQRENIQRYGETFDPEYAGYGRGGETMMATARNLPFLTGKTTEEAAAWWQDYDRYKNVVRNELFGSALTDNEKAEFDKADINPNMSPETIKKNIARQEQAINSALRKNANALMASGYSREAIESALGVSLDELMAQPETTPRSDNELSGMSDDDLLRQLQGGGQ